MNQNAIYQDENFSFKKLTELLKKSLKRMLIFALVFGIIGACVAATIVVISREDAEYKGIIEYKYKNIDDGLDPKGNILDTSRIVSNSMIYDALKTMGNISEEKITEIMPIISDDLIVNGYISDTMKKALETNPALTYFPSRYEISVKNNSKTGLSKRQYLNFINKLMESYNKFFSEYYNYGKLVTLVVNEDTVSSASDYVNALNAYQNEIANLQAEINALPATYLQIKNKLQARLNILNMQASDIATYIFKNNVQKNGVSMTLTQYFDNEIAKYLEQETMYSAKAANTKAVLADYKVIYEQISNTNNTLSVTVADVTMYNKLVSDYQNESSLESFYKTKKAESQRSRDQVTGVVASNTERTTLENKFSALLDSFNSQIEEINKELTDYANLNLLSNGVSVAMGATIQPNLSFLPAVIAFVTILLLGILSAIIITYYKSAETQKQKIVEAVKDK